MTEKKEKTEQIRTTEEIAKRFTAIANELGLSKGKTLDALCSFFETAKAGKNYTEFEREIEDFANLLTKMNTLFKQVIEKGGEAQSSAEQQYKKLLDSKDNTIINLQKEIERLSGKAKRCEFLENENKTLREDLHTASMTIKGLEALGTRDPEIEKENAMLKGKVEALEHALEKVFLSNSTAGSDDTTKDTVINYDLKK